LDRSSQIKADLRSGQIWSNLVPTLSPDTKVGDALSRLGISLTALVPLPNFDVLIEKIGEK